MIQHQRRAHGEEGTEQSGSPGAQEGAENGSPTSKEGPELPTHPAAPTERSQAAQLSPPSPHPQMWHFWLWMQRRGAARSIVALRSVAQCGAGGCKGGKGLQRETPPPPAGSRCTQVWSSSPSCAAPPAGSLRGPSRAVAAHCGCGTELTAERMELGSETQNGARAVSSALPAAPRRPPHPNQRRKSCPPPSTPRPPAPARSRWSGAEPELPWGHGVGLTGLQGLPPPGQHTQGQRACGGQALQRQHALALLSAKEGDAASAGDVCGTDGARAPCAPLPPKRSPRCEGSPPPAGKQQLPLPSS